jgi:hypothetical protein
MGRRKKKMKMSTYANMRQVKVTKRGKEIFDRKATAKAIQDRLKYLRGEVEAERISYGEIAELQDLAKYIDPSDLLLMQWAGLGE